MRCPPASDSQRTRQGEARQPGNLVSVLCFFIDSLCDPGQVTSPLWADFLNCLTGSQYHPQGMEYKVLCSRSGHRRDSVSENSQPLPCPQASQGPSSKLDLARGDWMEKPARVWKKSSASSSTRSTQPGLQSFTRSESPRVKQKTGKVCLDHLEGTSKSKGTWQKTQLF